MRIIRATDARDETRHKTAGETGTATEIEAAGQKLPDEKMRTAFIVHTKFNPQIERNPNLRIELMHDLILQYFAGHNNSTKH